jgi:hypothetical protein
MAVFACAGEAMTKQLGETLRLGGAGQRTYVRNVL